MPSKKTTTGTNDRPKDWPIGQSAGGLPDDSSKPVDVDDAEVERVKDKLVDNKPQADKQPDKPSNNDIPGADGALSAGAEEDTYD
jgi:hypothetical protein